MKKCFSLAALCLLLGVPVLAGAVTMETIENGGFETGDFTGWTVTDSGAGAWVINDGTFDPIGPGEPLPPISGSYDALSHQPGPGLHILTEPLLIPKNVNSAVLSWADRIRNHDEVYMEHNQEWRVLLRDLAGGFIQEVFSTNPGDDLMQIGPNFRSFDLTATAKEREGEEIVVSFEEEDDQLWFNSTLDDVSFVIDYDLLRKELVDGPDRDGDEAIDLVVEVGQYVPTSYVFAITYNNLEHKDLKVLDTVPAEWQVGETSTDPAGNGTVSAAGANGKDNGKSATKIAWTIDPQYPFGSLLVPITTRQSPGKKNEKYKPTSCGALMVNNGATLYEIDPETGKPVFDPASGMPLPPLAVTPAIVLAAVEDVNGDGMIDYSGQGDEDGDGIPDLVEVQRYGTNPCMADTDGDGYADGLEVEAGTDPLDPNSSPGPVIEPVAAVEATPQALPVGKERSRGGRRSR